MSSIKAIALAKAVGGGGPSVTVEELTVNQNGTTTAPPGKAYNPVIAAVPNTYSAGDEGKVVSDGALVAQTSRTVTANNTYNTTLNNEMVVNVQPPLQEKTVNANGDVTPDTGYYGLSKVVVDVPQGGGGASANAVNFRDYDGSIVQSYSAADFAALTAMPENPSHEGLTAQGWNWSLADAKAYVATYGRLEIGQMYITDDGKTRVYIHLEKGRTSPMLGVCPNGTIDVDWGDGTAHDTLTGTSTNLVKWTPIHAYAAPGDYVIKLTVTGSMGFYGYESSNQYSGLLRYTSSDDSRNHVYQNAIQKIEIGSSVTSIGNSAFYDCFSLTSVTIPDNVTSIGNSAFYHCYSLASVTIPDGITSIGNSAFYYCYSLTSVTIPDSVTSIGSSVFNGCYSLASITIPDSITSISNSMFTSCYSLASVTIPDGITSIGNSAFYYCYSVAEYHLAHTTPPTLSNTNAFSGIAADCIIYVPYSADHSILEAYKTANNWSTYASHMQEEAA